MSQRRALGCYNPAVCGASTGSSTCSSFCIRPGEWQIDQHFSIGHRRHLPCVLKEHTPYQRVLDHFPGIGSRANSVTGPPGTKLRTDQLQILNELLAPCFIDVLHALSTKSFKCFQGRLLSLWTLELANLRIREHAPARIQGIGWSRLRQEH